MEDRKEDVTRILRDEHHRKEELYPILYDELKGIAQRRMSAERPEHTLQATALVHEAYMRLVGDEEIEWRGRGHFYAAATEAMRRILIDHARRIRSQKRGGDQQRVTLGAADSPMEVAAEELFALEEALQALETEDPRAAEVSRLRFLSGLTVEETAAALGISERSVHREWTFARARLYQLLGDDTQA